MYLGNFSRSLDDKNRILLPAKFRNELGGVCYVTMGPDKNLEIRDAKAFEVFSESLGKLNSLSKNQREYSRMILGSTHDLSFDKQGRIVLPDTLLKSAKLSKELVFVGVGNKIELFSKETYDEIQKTYEAEDSLDELAAKLHAEGVEL